jgi:glycosyltransferase involved in cell wall biosynthesis
MSSSAPLVSIVVPLFNKRPYIRRCLDSIRTQTVADFEVIVVDDGSSDGGGELVAGDDRFRVIQQANAGPGAARNRGIAAARAGLIAFLDADDEWDSEFLDAVIHLARKHPEAGILATGSRRLLDTGSVREITLSRPDAGTTKLVANYFRLVRKGEFITCSSVAAPAAVLRQTGGFPEKQRLGEDGDLWSRIAMAYPIAYDVRILATYHSEAEGRSFHQFKANPPYPALVTRMRERLAAQSVPAALRQDIEVYLESKLLQYAYWLLSLRERERLAALLRSERFHHAPYRIEAMALRLASPFLPARLIQAVKVRAARAILRLRQARIIRALPGERDSVSVYFYSGKDQPRNSAA